MRISEICGVNFDTKEIVTSLPMQQVLTKDLGAVESYGKFRI